MATVSPNGAASRGATPVIGVVLLVVISVLLAAILGTFALDEHRENVQVGPQAAVSAADMDADYDTTDADAEDFLRVHHISGWDVEMNSVRISVRRQNDSKVVAIWEAGFNESRTNGSWTAELNGEDLSTEHVFSTSDVIEFRVQDDGGTPPSPADNTDYRVIFEHTDTETKIMDTVLTIE